MGRRDLGIKRALLRASSAFFVQADKQDNNRDSPIFQAYNTYSRSSGWMFLVNCRLGLGCAEMDFAELRIHHQPLASDTDNPPAHAASPQVLPLPASCFDKES